MRRNPVRPAPLPFLPAALAVACALGVAAATAGCHTNGGASDTAPTPTPSGTSPSVRVTPSRGPEEGRDELVEVVGTLTDEGVECQALRSDDGDLYTLTGRTEGFSTGDRVRVRGTVAQTSFCMQGTTLEVSSIGEAEER